MNMAKAGQQNDELDFPDDAPGNADSVLPNDDDVAVQGDASAAADGGADADFEVEVVDDTPEKDRGRQPLNREVAEPTEDEMREYSEKVQSRIKELTHARHDARRKAEALERQQNELQRVTQQLLDENRRLRGFVDTGSKQFIDTSVALAEREVAEATSKLRAAQEAFDSDAIVSAQDALMDAKIRLREVKNMRPTALQEEKPVVQQRPEPGEDQIDPRTLRWQQENQWFGRQGNEEHTAVALAVHKKLIDSGYDPTTEAYFEQLDARVYKVFPELRPGAGSTQRETQPQRQSRPSSVVAPATRTSSTKKVQLSASQVALAARLGLTPQQYAVELAKTQKES
jgi:hypothetical protein